MTRGAVPVARRQLSSEPAKVIVALAAVAAAVTLVLLLSGLRRGMGEQVTVYLDHQPPVLVGTAGARDFVAQASILTERTADYCYGQDAGAWYFAPADAKANQKDDGQ